LKNSIPVDESKGENLVRISKSQGGFSLTELLVTVAILMVGGAVAVMNVAGAVRSSHVETAYQNTLDQLRFARQVAIDKRTVCRVDFTAPGTVSVTQAFADGTPVQTETITLPADVQYTVVAGMPTPPTPTPDNLGNGTVAIDFDRVAGGSGATIFFQPDGSALDAAGRTNDGVIYVARPNELTGARAITLLGTTGRLRGWRLGPKPGGGVLWQ
jgi:prepilin-type N-terminal cleavage/methylation domain-containing protein